MHITKILVTACLLFFGTTYAQVVKQTVQLNENSIDAVAFGQGTSRYILAAVKINPLLIAIGDFPVSFEYAPWDNFSVEAGIGITFRNYLRDESGIPDAEVDYNPGFSLLINIKSFRYEDALDNGDYFSLQYSRRLYNREIFIPGYPSVFKEKRIENDFSLIYGWQLFFIKDRLFVDLYSGMGLRKFSGTSVQLVYDFVNGGTYYASVPPDSDMFNVKFIIPIGAKLGFLF